MKKAFFALLIIFAGCTKEDTAPNCMDVTFYTDTYTDTSWKTLVKTDAWHAGVVCGDLLTSYLRLDPDMQICNEPKRQRIVFRSVHTQTPQK